MSLKKSDIPSKPAFHITFLKNFYIFKRDIKKFCFFKILVPFRYALAKRRPIEDNKVIFLEISSSRLSDNYKILFNRLESEYDLDIHVHFLEREHSDKAELYKRQLAYIKDAATAKYIIMSDSYNFTGALRKRRGQHIINLWHACGAFKRFGFSIADKKFGMDYSEMKRFPLHPEYDFVTVSSPEITWAYAEAMGKEKTPSMIRPLGVSRTDIFYDDSFKVSAREHLLRLFPEIGDRKVILYAPTFRGHINRAETPDMLSIPYFYEHFKDKYVLLFNHHPFVKSRPAVSGDLSGFARDMTGLMSIEELLCITDICISDYSSLIFEYSLFEKPMIFYAYDLANYFDWRGFYYSYDELTPGPVFSTNAEMISYIEHIDTLFDRSVVTRFKERFMSACDGHATERIISELFGNDIEHLKRPAPLTGDFSQVPHQAPQYYEYYSRLDFLKKIEHIFTSEYEKAIKRDIIKGSVCLMTDEYTDGDIFYSLEKELSRDPGFTVTPDISVSKENAAEYARALATAEYIIASGQPYLLRMIDVRPETKLIEAESSSLPLYNKWNASRMFRVSYLREEMLRFPVKASFSAVMDGSGGLNVPENYDSLSPALSGSIYSDNLTDESYIKESRGAVIRLCPEAEDQTLIFLDLTPRPELRLILRDLLIGIYEEFAGSAKCLVTPAILPLVPEFMQGFVLCPEESLRSAIESEDESFTPEEMSGLADLLTEMRLIAASGIIISDYSDIAPAALKTDKRLIIYAPDISTYEMESELKPEVMKFLDSFFAASVSDLKDMIRIGCSDEEKIAAGFIRDNFLKDNASRILIDKIMK